MRIDSYPPNGEPGDGAAGPRCAAPRRTHPALVGALTLEPLGSWWRPGGPGPSPSYDGAPYAQLPETDRAPPVRGAATGRGHVPGMRGGGTRGVPGAR